MIISTWKQFIAVFCFLFSAGLSVAQEPVLADKNGADVPKACRLLDFGTSQLGFWGGYSSDNPTLIGKTTDRPLFELNVHYARVIKTRDSWALKYTAEIIPVISVRQPPQGFSNGNTMDLPGKKEWVYGAGLSPVGLQMNFFRGRIVQPYINGTAGVLYFTKNVPVAHSSNFNFTFGFGAGVEIWYLENQSILLGYKYQHISNGYTAPENPGVDSNLLYVGFLWRLMQ